MNLSKEIIEKRIILISQEINATKETLFKLEGHLNEAKHWLVDILNQESEDAEEENKNGEANQQGESQVIQDPVCAPRGEKVPH